MKKLLIALPAGLAALAVVQGCGRAEADPSAKVSESRDVQLTIYKEDFALVHETRAVDLGAGQTRVRLDNVSKSLDPMSVIFDWGATDKQGPEVTSSMYDLGVDGGTALLRRLEGKQVDMLWHSQDGRPGDKIHGRLEATREGGYVIRTDDLLYINPNGTIVASNDSSLVTMPQLSAEVQSRAGTHADLGFAYQTRGMSWSSDYVGRLSAAGDALQLECWATLENHTGIDYPNAKITLVAGEPNRAARSREYEMRAGGGVATNTPAAMADSSLAKMEAQSVGELYAYKVPASASVGQEQMNRVRMLRADRVPIKKDYSIGLDPVGPYGYSAYEGDSNSRRQNAQLSISFVNDEASGLGVPLPGGAVRIYDETSSDSTAFVGAAGIGDTPKNQHVSLTLSKVFDVYGDSRVTKSQPIGKHIVRRTFEIVLHNEKKSVVDVRLVQMLYGKVRLISESDKSVKLNASTYQRTVRVEPGGQKTVTWTAEFVV